ncbi:glycosyltransferase family 2 protein [Hyphomicrobium sp.]|uniref:glycosyltransferase family 2 protein n=1 Tax=Hyphomicrobium sp. TaxID=82 RepID=UPI002E37D3E0|nr:glycosyltransferase family 2 protein [Hyphomicrobium sp.]HEX2842186.1 glycosyltransferase family 2 protein [Hyphomicrobium sp.]
MNPEPTPVTTHELADNSISVVIPALNEAGNIGLLVRETVSCIPAFALREIVVVDDGSDDATPDELRALASEIPKLRYVRHQQRAGQSAAVRTGVRTATAPIIATMDGDGQNDPRDIAALVSRLDQADRGKVALAGGVRTTRRAESSKRVASKFANWLRDAILDDHCPDTGCGIKAFRREVFLDLPYYSGMHRYLPALFQAYGYEAVYHPVNDRPRRAGQSKYTNLGRALIGIYDLIGVRWLIRRTILPDRVPTANQSLRSASKEETRACTQN